MLQNYLHINFQSYHYIKWSQKEYIPKDGGGGGDKLYMYIQTILQQSSIRTQKQILSELWECSVQVPPPLMVVFMGALQYGYIRAAAVRQFIQYLDWNFNFGSRIRH